MKIIIKKLKLWFMRNIFRLRKDKYIGYVPIIFDDFKFLKGIVIYKKLKKIERCFRRLLKICKRPDLNIEDPKPSLNEALAATQYSYDEGIGYVYKFDELINKHIYPNARRDLIVNAKLIYFNKQDEKDKLWLKEKIIEIYNEKNKYTSRITLLFNYIMRVKDELYEDLYKEVLNSNTRLTFELIWFTYPLGDVQDYKRVLSKFFNNIPETEKELLKEFLETMAGYNDLNPRFLKIENSKEKKEVAKKLLDDLWYYPENSNPVVDLMK